MNLVTFVFLRKNKFEVLDVGDRRMSGWMPGGGEGLWIGD